MHKSTHTKRHRLPRIEQPFLQALESIRHTENWTVERLLQEIERQPGDTLAGKARLYALSYYRDDRLTHTGFREESAGPLEAALQAVQKCRTKA